MDMPACPASPDGAKCSDRDGTCTSSDGNVCVCGSNKKWSCVSSGSYGGVISVCPKNPGSEACVSGICAGNGTNLCVCLLGSWQCLGN